MASPVAAGNAADDKELAYWAARLATESQPASQYQQSEPVLRVEPMEKSSEQRRANTSDDEDDLLLDLDDLDSSPMPVTFDDAVLELEDEVPQASAMSAGFTAESYSATAMPQASLRDDIPYATEIESGWTASADQSAPDSAGGAQDLGASWEIVPPPAPFERVNERQTADQASAPSLSNMTWMEDVSRAATEPGPSGSTPAQSTGQRLSPEDIDAIARRVVEHMSERTVRDIAWEVVPELAELMIKRRLEEEH
jgi:hypothetical protein